MKKKIAGGFLAIATFVALMFGGSPAQASWTGPNWINFHQHVVAWNVWGPFDRYCTYADYRSATGIVIARHVAVHCSYDIR